jgi:UDP-GlcNAc:undecaprenyl-phosphate GlcNAc-1-phosphate transferase
VYQTASVIADEMLSVYDGVMWIGLIWGAALTWVSIKLLTPLAERLKLIDFPSEQRKAHSQPTPILGAALVIGTLSAWWLWQDTLSIVLGLGSLAMFLLGADDDRHGRSALFKLIAQLFIASVVVAFSGMSFQSVSVADWQFSLGIMAIPWTVLWLVTVTNAFNLIDGSDGLVVGVSILIATGMGLITGHVWVWGLVGSGIIFWCYNKPPAKCFSGDGGAYFAGFFLAMLSLAHATAQTQGDFSLIGMALLFLVPLSDLGFSIVRRIFKKQSVMDADHDHIHHRLQRKWGVWGMLIILYVSTVLSMGLWFLFL